MSDQSTDLKNTQYVGVGGSGVVSVNGDTSPAQVIAAGTGITVSNAGAVHTIINNGVVSFGKTGTPRTGSMVIAAGTGITITESPNGTFTFSLVASSYVASVGTSTPRSGAITLVAGVGITITESPNGTFTFAATGAGGVTSFGLAGTPRTGAVVIAAGSNITITESPSGTFTIATVGGSGITSINGDGTAAQIIAGSGAVTVTNAGATHTIAVSNFSASAAGLVPSPAAFDNYAKLTKLGWVDFDASSDVSPWPGTGQTLYVNTSNLLDSFIATYSGWYLLIGSAQTSQSTSFGATDAVGLTIFVGGSPVRTFYQPVKNGVTPYLQISHMAYLTAGASVSLQLYNATAVNLTSHGWQFDRIKLM